jgi:hypothetical protein
MAKKKELDKLSLDMIQCEKDGFGCHYGRWKALQDKPVVVEKKEKEVIPDGWKACKNCGKLFKIGSYGKNRVYCDVTCQRQAASKRKKSKYNTREYNRRYMEKKRAEGSN